MTFEKIQGGDFSFIEDDKIKNAIDYAGKRIIVFVEGEDDKILFQIFLNEYISKITFVDVAGCEKVEKYVENLKNEEVYFGVIDRDFRTDDEIEQKMADIKYNNKLFIFKERYTIENYLIEDNILQKFLEEIGKKYTLTEIKVLIKETFESLIPISIGNFILLQHRKEFFNKDAQTIPQEYIATRVAREIYGVDCTEKRKEEIDTEIKNVQDKFNLVNDYHKFISGKYFFVYFGREVGYSNFKNEIRHLARMLMLDFKTIPPEILNIVNFIGLTEAQ